MAAALPGTPRFMHFNKANIKCLLINILGHDIIHDYGPSMIDRWKSNKTIVTQFSADRFTMVGGLGMLGGMFQRQRQRTDSDSDYEDDRAQKYQKQPLQTRQQLLELLQQQQQRQRQQDNLMKSASQIYSQVHINEGIITDQIGNAMLFSFFGKVMYYLYLKQKITAVVVGGGVINAQAAQDFYNSLDANAQRNGNVQSKIRDYARSQMNLPPIDHDGPWTDAELILRPDWSDTLINIARIFHEGLNIFDAQLFNVSDNMYQDNFVNVNNNNKEIIPRDIFQNVQDSFSLYVRTRAPGGADFNDDLNYNPPAGQPPYNLPAITYTQFFDLFDAFTKDNKNLRYRKPAQGQDPAYDVVIDGAGKIDGILINSYGLTKNNYRQFETSLQPLNLNNYHFEINDVDDVVEMIFADDDDVDYGGGKKDINQSGGADEPLNRAQSVILIDEISHLLNSIVTINNNNYSVAPADPADSSITIFREIVAQYVNYFNANNDAAIQACVALSVTPLVYNAANQVVIAQSGYYALIKLLRNEFNAIFLDANAVGDPIPPQPSKSAAMFDDYKMFSDIKRNKLRNLPNEENFIKTFYLRINNLLDSYRVIVSKDIDLQRQAQAKLDADARKELLGDLTKADEAVLGDFCTFMARAALTCTDIIDTSGIVKLPNVWTQQLNNATRPASLTNYYTTKNLNVAAQAALPAPFNNVANWGAGIDSIEARRNVPPPLAAGGVNNYYLSSTPAGQPVARQNGSQALAKETSILLYIAGYAGYGIQGNVDRNIISDTNYWLGWNDVSSASLDEVLIKFIRDKVGVGGAYKFPAIEATDRILQANNMFCRHDNLRKYIINNAAVSRPGGVKPQEFCPYSSILDGMSMCGWNSSNGSGRESGNMNFCYIGALDFSSALNNNLATPAQINQTSYYQGKSTLTGIDPGLDADNIQIELNIRPNDNWPFPPISVNVNTNISSNNNLDAKVVLATTLKTYITRITGGTIQGAAVGAPPVVPAPLVVPSLDPGVLDVIFNTGTLLHTGMGMAAGSTKSGIFTRLFQYYNNNQNVASFANFYQDWVYGEITKKGIGDIFQEVNAMCKYGGYSLIRPNNAAAAAYMADRGTYRVSSERIISYLESPATQTTAANFTMADNNTRMVFNAGAADAAALAPTGDQLRLFIAEDRPSGFRAGFVRKFGRQQDINNRASGGYYDGTNAGSFIVRPHGLNFCTNVAQAAAGGGSKQNRKTRKHKKIVKTKKNMKMRKGRKTRVRGNPIKKMKQKVPRKRITKKVK
jgi:hypothetical protein